VDKSSNLVWASLPGTLPQLRQRTGLARSTITRAIQNLKALDKCHIREYRPNPIIKGAPPAAYYVKGRGNDAEPPAAPERKGPRGLPADGSIRARVKAITDANRVAKIRDPWLWFLFDVTVQF